MLRNDEKVLQPPSPPQNLQKQRFLFSIACHFDGVGKKKQKNDAIKYNERVVLKSNLTIFAVICHFNITINGNTEIRYVLHAYAEKSFQTVSHRHVSLKRHVIESAL